MGLQKSMIPVSILAWCISSPILMDSSKSNDPVLIHMCSRDFGAKFWRNFLECSLVMETEVLDVLTTCIPIATPEEAENTRCSVCSRPDQWIKMMDCMNTRLIELQDESNPDLELSAGLLYKTCVLSLTDEANRALSEQTPFMPEDARPVHSNCSIT